MSLPRPITPEDLSRCTFDGYYTLLERIGQGGYGTVYRAIENPSKDIVAIKVVRTPELGSYPTTTANLRAGDIGGPSFAVTRHRAATWQ